VRVADALVTAQARGSEGARVRIAAWAVMLGAGVINGRAAGADVPVDIGAGAAFVRSPAARMESDAVTAPVEAGIAGSLTRLPGGEVGL
jgi:hypothetical protein